MSKVLPGEAKPEQGKEEIANLDRIAGADQLDAYVTALRARGKVEVNRANLEKKQ